jgi:hypothetical protein
VKKRKFEIGQRVWEFDANRRIYRRDADGRSFGGSIFAEHFREMKVWAVEGRSYVIGLPDPQWAYSRRKVGFQKAEEAYRTDDEKAADIWLNDHRYPLSQLVGRCDDVGLLKKVAGVVGYEPEAK